jgi:hypothetical protein
MTATLSSPPARVEPQNHFVLHGVSWQLYEMLFNEMERCLKMPLSVDRTTMLLEFRDWVRQNAKR